MKNIMITKNKIFQLWRSPLLQVRNLMLENRSQIELMRRTKQEHESELSHILRQNKSEAARDMARLRLAEKIIQEKDHDLMEVSHQAGCAQMEMEALKEELVSLRTSTRTISVEGSGGEGAGSGVESSSPSIGSMTRVSCLSVCLYILNTCTCTCMSGWTTDSQICTSIND